MGLLDLTSVVADLAARRHSPVPDPYVVSGGSSGGGSFTFGPGLVLFGGVLLIAAIAYLSYASRQRRRNGFQTMATQYNLSYSQDDTLGLLGYPFTLFTKGDGRTLENVVYGAWQEVEVIAFDYLITRSRATGSREPTTGSIARSCRWTLTVRAWWSNTRTC